MVNHKPESVDWSYSSGQLIATYRTHILKTHLERSVHRRWLNNEHNHHIFSSIIAKTDPSQKQGKAAIKAKV